MVQYCFTSTETIRFVGRTAQDGHLDTHTAPELCMEVGEREIIYLSLHCHHKNDFCIKVGSDESHFNVS